MEDCRKLAAQRVVILDPSVSVAEARIVCEGLGVGGPKQATTEFFWRRQMHHERQTIASYESEDLRPMASGGPRRHFPILEKMRSIFTEEGQRGLQQRRFDLLPEPRRIAGHERGQHAIGGKRARQMIG